MQLLPWLPAIQPLKAADFSQEERVILMGTKLWFNGMENHVFLNF